MKKWDVHWCVLLAIDDSSSSMLSDYCGWGDTPEEALNSLVSEATAVAEKVREKMQEAQEIAVRGRAELERLRAQG